MKNNKTYGGRQHSNKIYGSKPLSNKDFEINLNWTIKYKSNAKWEDYVYTNEYGKHVSSDTHNTKEQAHDSCKMLKCKGFGGMGKDFPKKIWVSCIILKSIVLEIAEYQGKLHKGYADEYDRVLAFINSQPDEIDYELFMSKVGQMYSCKLIGNNGKFIRPFMERLKNVKRGKDWRNLN